MSAWDLLLDIVILLGASLTAGLVCGRLRQNAIVGYILAGILLGRAGFGLIRTGPALEALAELGVALLLFSIGLEFSWARLRKFGTLALGGGTLQVSLTLVVFAGLMALLGFRTGEAVVAGAAVALSSTAVVLRVLTDRGEMDSRHGRNSLAILLLQDVAVIPLILLVRMLGGGSGGESLLSFGVSLLQGGALVAAMVILSRRVLPRLLATASSFRDRDLPILLAVSVFLLATWASHTLVRSPVLGAFVAGMLLAETPYAEQIRADLTPLRAAFVTIFFTSIGMLVERPSSQTIGHALALAAVILTVKAILVAGVLLLFRRPRREALQTGMALAQIGEFSFVLAAAARRSDLIEDGTFQVLLSASLLTLLATPYLIALAARLPAGGGRRKAGMLDAPGSGQRRVLVVGFGPAGQAVVEELRDAGLPLLVLELNPNTVAAHRADFPIEIGDATQREILEHFGVSSAAAVVVTIPDPGTARMIIRQAKILAPDIPVISRSRHHLHAPELLEAGADAIVDEEEIVGAQIAVRLRALLPDEATGTAVS